MFSQEEMEGSRSVCFVEEGAPCGDEADILVTVGGMFPVRATFVLEGDRSPSVLSASSTFDLLRFLWLSISLPQSWQTTAKGRALVSRSSTFLRRSCKKATVLTRIS